MERPTATLGCNLYTLNLKPSILVGLVKADGVSLQEFEMNVRRIMNGHI